jgi:hypothetical protein
MVWAPLKIDPGKRCETNVMEMEHDNLSVFTEYKGHFYCDIKILLWRTQYWTSFQMRKEWHIIFQIPCCVERKELLQQLIVFGSQLFLFWVWVWVWSGSGSGSGFWVLFLENPDKSESPFSKKQWMDTRHPPFYRAASYKLESWKLSMSSW